VQFGLSPERLDDVEVNVVMGKSVGAMFNPKMFSLAHILQAIDTPANHPNG